MRTHPFHITSGEKQDQLLLLVDEQGEPIGTATRDVCHRGMGKRHLAFLAFLLDSDGMIVLARRSRRKSLWPGYWDAAVVSHVLSGETVEDAARRRGKEEMGVDIAFFRIGAFSYTARQGDFCENEFCHVLWGKTDTVIHSNPVEIDSVRLVGKKELRREVSLHADAFTPWFRLAVSRTDLPFL